MRDFSLCSIGLTGRYVRELRAFNGRAWRSERGFTLPELLMTIAILGILLAIAIAIWNSVIDARRVDAAANQLASDLRLAHTKATNQLTDWRVVVTEEPGASPEDKCGGDYCLVRLEEPYTEESDEPKIGDFTEHELPEGTEVYFSEEDADDDTTVPADPDNKGTKKPSLHGKTRTVEFNSDGTARALGSPSGTFVVSAEGGDPSREIVFLSATARVELKD